MSLIKNIYLNILLILGFWILFLSFYDVIYGMDWFVITLVNYAILIILITLLLFFYSRRPTIPITVEEFEKRLMGGLYHFKCPSCNGIFAVKKSKSNDTKEIKMTCPDCGITGIIPTYPEEIELIGQINSVITNSSVDIDGVTYLLNIQGLEIEDTEQRQLLVKYNLLDNIEYVYQNE